jgi:hypothetical protein
METYKTLRLLNVDSPEDIEEIIDLAQKTLKKRKVEYKFNAEQKRLTFPKLLETDCFSFEFVLRKLMDSREVKEYVIELTDELADPSTLKLIPSSEMEDPRDTFVLYDELRPSAMTRDRKMATQQVSESQRRKADINKVLEAIKPAQSRLSATMVPYSRNLEIMEERKEVFYWMHNGDLIIPGFIVFMLCCLVGTHLW